MDGRIFSIALTLLPKINNFECLKLIEACGGIANFFIETESLWTLMCKAVGFDASKVDRKKALKDATQELYNIDKYNIKIVTFEDANYPKLLRNCLDAPLVLYYKGILKPQEYYDIFLSVVGTRKATGKGIENTTDLITKFKELGYRPTIVSGLAYGIDIAAHRAALNNELPTFAVLGHGLDKVYPSQHCNYAMQILENKGALISEYPVILKTQSYNFLQRNRIVAGISQATLVMESAVKGGSMTTARVAFSYDREVMVFPGRKDDVYSLGCNQLIKQNIASLVENVEDILKIMNISEDQKISSQINLNFSENNEFSEANMQEKGKIIDILKENDLSLNELSLEMGISVQSLSVILLKMEIEGIILKISGGYYRLKSTFKTS